MRDRSHLPGLLHRVKTNQSHLPGLLHRVKANQSHLPGLLHWVQANASGGQAAMQLAAGKALLQSISIVLQPAQSGILSPWRHCIPALGSIT